MADVPVSISPTKISTFTRCPLLFWFRELQRLPEPVSEAAVRGKYIHRVLERFFSENRAEERTPESLMRTAEKVREEMDRDPEFSALGLEGDQKEGFFSKAEEILNQYLSCEDPVKVRPIAVELKLEMPMEGVVLRGIVDRVDRLDDGRIEIVDYKTGRPPSAAEATDSLSQVLTYALLLEKVTGLKSSRVRLLFLSDGISIEREVSASGIEYALERARQVLSAIRLAVARRDFRPSPSAFCVSCNFRRYCPAYGGDPARARAELLASAPDGEASR